MTNYIHLSEEGQVVSHVTKKTSTMHPGSGTGSGIITPSGIVTPPITPGGATRDGKHDDTDPAKTGPVKKSRNDDTPPSKKSSKNSDEEKEFSDKGTEPKGMDDLKSGSKPKKSKSKKKKVSIKKQTGKLTKRIDSSTESEDDDDDDIDDNDEFLEPEEKTIMMNLKGDPGFENVFLTENQKMPQKRSIKKEKETFRRS